MVRKTSISKRSNISFREGLVESKLRFLVANLEQTENLQHAYPYPKSFIAERKEDENLFRSYFFMGLKLNITQTGSKTIDLSPAVLEFSRLVKEWPTRESTMDIKILYILRKNLPDFVFEEGKKLPTKTKKRKLTDQPITGTIYCYSLDPFL